MRHRVVSSNEPLREGFDPCVPARATFAAPIDPARDRCPRKPWPATSARCRPCSCDQQPIEPILRARAVELAADVRFGTKVIGLEAGHEGVSAVLGDAPQRPVRDRRRRRAQPDPRAVVIGPGLVPVPEQRERSERIYAGPGLPIRPDGVIATPVGTPSPVGRHEATQPQLN